MYRRSLSLSQSQGYLSGRLFEPLQMHPCGSKINAAEYPATLLESAPALFSPARLYHRIETHPSEGDEKVGKKAFGVLPPQDFRLSTYNHYYGYPHIFQALWVSVAAGGVTVDHQRMHFSA
jgi:hypothetical protein